MAAPKKQTSVVKAQTTDVAKLNYGEDTGRGYEHQTGEDIAIPFITVLQALSPQVTEKRAEAGKLFNTVTEETYEEFGFVPSTTDHNFVEWIPRKKGGGFVAVHKLDSDLVKATLEAATNRFQTHELENGNELAETFYMYGILCHGAEPVGAAVLSFQSSFIKKYKGINTRLQSFMLKTPEGKKVKPPLFAHLLKVKTVSDKNDQGTWFNFDISPANGEVMNSLLAPEDPRYQAARELNKMILAGTAKAAYETSDKTTSAGDKVPF